MSEGCRRKIGRPKKTWRHMFTEDLIERGVSWTQRELPVAEADRGKSLPNVPIGTEGKKSKSKNTIFTQKCLLTKVTNETLGPDTSLSVP